jgi:hypothetical protein
MGPDGARAVFPNTPEGIAQLAAFCCARQAELVAMEATGGYEQQPFLLLSAQGLSVAILNPRQVRRFAEGMGRMEKTDAIDAGLIAWFAEVKRSRPSPPPAPPQNRPAVYPLPGAQSKDPPKIRGPRRAGFARWGGRKGSNAEDVPSLQLGAPGLHSETREARKARRPARPPRRSPGPPARRVINPPGGSFKAWKKRGPRCSARPGSPHSKKRKLTPCLPRATKCRITTPQYRLRTKTGLRLLPRFALRNRRLGSPGSRV